MRVSRGSHESLITPLHLCLQTLRLIRPYTKCDEIHVDTHAQQERIGRTTTNSALRAAERRTHASEVQPSAARKPESLDGAKAARKAESLEEAVTHTCKRSLREGITQNRIIGRSGRDHMRSKLARPSAACRIEALAELIAHKKL